MAMLGSDTAFAQGEVVQLRSGGPLMTVMFVQGRLIKCGWFWSGRYRVESFGPDELRHPSKDTIQAALKVKDQLVAQ